METNQQPEFGFDPTTGRLPPPQPVHEERKPLAPVWHTILIVVLMLLNSAGSAWLVSRATSSSVSEQMRIAQYLATIALELFLLFLVWIGLRIGGTRVRDLVGGRWDTVEDFLLDVAIAFGFFVCAYIVIAGLSFGLGLAKPSQIGEAKKLANLLAPHTWIALLVFVSLSAIAGFVEELIFRGYLQRQIAILSGKTYVGLVVSALIFGAGHGYEGARRMLLIFILGLMFGCLALWRKSLRPGMMGHALIDSAQGIILFVATRTGMLQAS